MRSPVPRPKVTCEPYKQQFHFIHAEAPLPHDGHRAGGGGDDDRAITVASAPNEERLRGVLAEVPATARCDLASKTPHEKAAGHRQRRGCSARHRRKRSIKQGRHDDWWLAALSAASPVTMMEMAGGLAAESADAFDQFLRYYLPDGPRLPAHRSSGAFPPLEAGTCALGVLTLGRTVGDPGLQRHSVSLCGDALGFARRLIARTTLDNGNWLPVLETVTLLSLFEVREVTSEDVESCHWTRRVVKAGWSIRLSGTRDSQHTSTYAKRHLIHRGAGGTKQVFSRTRDDCRSPGPVSPKLISLFLPTLAANHFLKRNNGDDEEVMAACRRTANTFIERGFQRFRNYA
ncbi:hypothetical protein ISF_05253 [Cordyceps fumosorosea ARSEF 2679]|uniref:Uncharacterized protein n=1 Tax=Cordyceps fumosorosea (strain ARSEF 2679) TaxID=1081104 RepID=A0A167V5E4_CORFA|nr:hypothetical protein ISF_05253 [Cordyceps fumosorosea ARSEF 2679]OAA62244.1 hypothetical protein ISF_05253 [Cordyceps fumosorosea ARSEF 2679]